MADNRGGDATDDGTDVERRIDMTDPDRGAYTYDEFLEFYGTDAQWLMAEPAAPPPATAPLPPPPPQPLSTVPSEGGEDEGGATEQLTALGHHLAALPIDVRIGKLLVLGTMLQCAAASLACLLPTVHGQHRLLRLLRRCADPALTLAAALSVKSPFVAPYGRRNEADESKANWAVGASDHLAVLRAYQAWDALPNERKRWAFCAEHFLSHKALQTIAQTKRELLENLWEIGFIRPGASARKADLSARAVAEQARSPCLSALAASATLTST